MFSALISPTVKWEVADPGPMLGRKYGQDTGGIKGYAPHEASSALVLRTTGALGLKGVSVHVSVPHLCWSLIPHTNRPYVESLVHKYFGNPLGVTWNAAVERRACNEWNMDLGDNAGSAGGTNARAYLRTLYWTSLS